MLEDKENTLVSTIVLREGLKPGAVRPGLRSAVAALAGVVY